ncbi:MAG: hypothetical protein NT121_20195 [Chloroflexi bacterium]|nr:hypothetical protein [Chloroflexota bacterium]
MTILSLVQSQPAEAMGHVVWCWTNWPLLHDMVTESQIKDVLAQHPEWQPTIRHSAGVVDQLHIMRPSIDGGWVAVAIIEPIS